jgi:hypothetical protein
LADAAFRAAAVQVIERAKQSGTPVIIWEDGHVKQIPAEETERRLTRSKQKQTKRPRRV